MLSIGDKAYVDLSLPKYNETTDFIQIYIYIYIYI